MGTLTELAVRNARTDKSEAWLCDGDGLWLRVRKDNAVKAWVFRYTRDGKSRKLTIGSYPTTGLSAARDAAIALRQQLQQHLDPIQERKRQILERKAESEKLAARITAEALFKRWLDVKLSSHKDKGAAVSATFHRHVLPTLGKLCVEDIQLGHITNVTDKLLARGVTRQAKLTFGLMRQFFRFAVSRGVIEADPTAAIKKADIGETKERDRVLSEAELRAFTKQLPEAGLKPEAQCALWLCLATCCRIGELLSARWADVDTDAGTWFIPAENSKNGKAHTISLSAFALKHLEVLKGLSKARYEKRLEVDSKAIKSVWLFANKNYDGPLNIKTITKQTSDRQRADKAEPLKRRTQKDKALLLPGGKWTPHDLRRTGATLMGKIGVLPEVAERCLNHLEQNRIKRIYQRYSYEAEMREAWRLLGERLELLTNTPANVVIFRKVA